MSTKVLQSSLHTTSTLSHSNLLLVWTPIQWTSTPLPITLMLVLRWTGKTKVTGLSTWSNWTRPVGWCVHDHDLKEAIILGQLLPECNNQKMLLPLRKCTAAAVSARKTHTQRPKEGPRMTLRSPKLLPCISYCCWPCIGDLPEWCTCCSIAAAPQEPPLRRNYPQLWRKKLKFCSE